MIITIKALEYLKSRDRDLEVLINRYPKPDLTESTNVYRDIIDTIIGQMLSQKAAMTISKRVQTLLHSTDYDAMVLAHTTIDQLRACGLSTAKATSIISIAIGITTKTIDFEQLINFSDEEVIKYLENLKGIGRWTSEMIALFSLGRLDIFSRGDLALKHGIIKAKGYKTLSNSRFENLRRKYHPYASIASLYFYLCHDDPLFKRTITS